ncbi:MAG: hypothetical protein WAM14_26940 [Candidatus Nitrosopolaris sp.]
MEYLQYILLFVLSLSKISFPVIWEFAQLKERPDRGHGVHNIYTNFRFSDLKVEGDNRLMTMIGHLRTSLEKL